MHSEVGGGESASSLISPSKSRSAGSSLWPSLYHATAGYTHQQSAGGLFRSSEALSDLFQLGGHVAKNSQAISGEPTLASSYQSEKMTICGPGGINAPSSNRGEGNRPGPNVYPNSQSSSTAVSPIDHLRPSIYGRHSTSSSSSGGSPVHQSSPPESDPRPFCIHGVSQIKCESCNDYSSIHLAYKPAGIGQRMMNMNSESLLAHENKSTIFGPPTSSAAHMGLGGHLGPIGSSIAGMGGAGGLHMAGSHLHHSSHHPHQSSHHPGIHSMATPGFTLHSHLMGGGQRRISTASSSSGPSGRMKGSNSNKQFHCPMCPKVFTQKGNLKTHMMIHTGDKPYACHVCGKSFTQKGNVDTHIKIHTGVKDYGCERCDKSFTQKGNLKTHIRSVHTKEKPYACNVCGKSFSQKGNMRTHVRTHNKDDRFPCTLCGKTFSQKGNLKTHMQRHAGTLPKRHGPGQRRQTTSRILQVPGISSGAAAAAAAAYAIAAAGNFDRPVGSLTSQAGPSSNSIANRVSPISPIEQGNSPLTTQPPGTQRTMNQTSVITGNVQTQEEAERTHHSMSTTTGHQSSGHTIGPSLYHGSSETSANHSQHHNYGYQGGHNGNALSPHLQQSPPGHNSFRQSAAAAAAAVFLSSTSGFGKDHKTNHLHFMSSLFQ